MTLRSDSISGLQENLRQLCVFKLGSEANKPWVWWDYTTRFSEQCSMTSQNYGSVCPGPFAPAGSQDKRPALPLHFSLPCQGLVRTRCWNHRQQQLESYLQQCMSQADSTPLQPGKVHKHRPGMA